MGSKGSKADCPLCGALVFVAGRLVSYHPPCPAFTLDSKRRYVRAGRKFRLTASDLNR